MPHFGAPIMKKVGLNEAIVELLGDDFVQTFRTDYFKIKNNYNVYDRHSYISKKGVFVGRKACVTQTQ